MLCDTLKDEVDKFLVGYGAEIVTVRWYGVSDKVDEVETIINLKDIEGVRWNDAKIDSNGELWVGYFRRGTEYLRIKSWRFIHCKLIKKNLKETGFPDGMTVDSDNNLWIATFAWKVVKVNPSNPSIISEVVGLPVEQITSCTFGGPNLDELYVTSASLEQNGRKPDGESVYRVRGLNVQGVACHKTTIS